MEVISLTIGAGQDIKQTILDWAVSQNIKRAFVIGAIGSAIDLSVTTPISYDGPLKTVEVPHRCACEIVGMSGEIFPWEEVDPKLKSVYPDKDSPLFVHLHVAAAMMGGSVFGGGLRGGKALRAVRVFVLPQ